MLQLITNAPSPSLAWTTGKTRYSFLRPLSEMRFPRGAAFHLDEPLSSSAVRVSNVDSFTVLHLSVPPRFEIMLFPLILLGLTACSSRAQDLEIDCSDPGLSAYLLSLVDTLYTAGLTTYEQLIAHIILTDDGYDLLSDLYYSDQNFTLLIPTNDAFGSTGIYGTWDQMSFPSFLPSDDDAVNLVAFHILQGFQGYDQLPVVPLHGVASTALKMNCSGATEEWQVQVMEKDPSGDGSIELRMASGNGSSWTSPLSVDQSVLGNLMLLPINMVLPFPPNLGSALAMSTSSRSQQGLGTLSSALNASTSGFNPSEIGPAGLTIFAPVNDAWTNQSVGQLEDPTTGPELMGNHVRLGAANRCRIDSSTC